jgi:putative ABC transport system substrate-binding protein
MRRREFLSALGSTAAWPLCARAQQPKMPVIAILYQAGPRSLLPPPITAFREGLRDAGFIEGHNIVIEYRAAEGPDRLPVLAAELVRLQVEVIAAGGSEAVRAARDATKRIPIVMTSSSDPVGSGFVASLAHPGGNITGMSVASPDLAAKRVELLREIVGEMPVIAVLWNPDDPPALQSLKETEIAARRFGIAVEIVAVRAPTDFDSAFASVMTARPKALNVLTAPIMTNHSARIAEFALKNGLPAISFTDQFPKAGGLMSYGPNISESYRRAAVYVAKILKGAQPADLPVEQPTKFALVINFKTAKALGLTISPAILARADEVID